ncbi:MAG TPA: MEDS domain-containing protein, partial [Sphingobacteriaceae bacterium]
MGDDNKWLKTSPREFWGELAPCEHVLQIYETEESFISTLAGFVCDGISSGDCTMVIATRQHIGALKEALSNQGLNVNALIGEGLFRPLDAKAALSNFMQAN